MPPTRSCPDPSVSRMFSAAPALYAALHGSPWIWQPARRRGRATGGYHGPCGGLLWPGFHGHLRCWMIPLSKKSKGRARAAGRAAGRISIRDTGIGMDAGVVAALFQPFIQADNSTSRKYGGSGLGLVISRQIIDAMGGQISIQGTPGAGTEISFTITLAPAAAPVGNGTTAAPLREAAAALSTESIGTLHVLLVEDNPVNQFYCNTLLREMGHAVDPANDGEQAMEKVRARHARAHGQCDG